MSADNSTFGIGHFIDPKFGSAVQIPLNFFTSGMVDAYQGYFGSLASQGLDFAALNVAPNPTAPISIFSKGLNEFIGETTQKGVHWTKGEHLVTGTELRTSVTNNSLKGAANTILGKTTIAGKKVSISSPKTRIDGAQVKITGADIRIGGYNWYARALAWNAKKPFDILHPTKEGHRLRYVCLEGPSAEVYVRGTLKDQFYIDLPDYWKGLVDEHSIGVNLTPIGIHQELFVKEIENFRIKVINNSGGPIHCHYVVYGERKDTAKNIPEYQGLTPNDYPGDNTEYNLK